ncbi:TetR/AcrR family transcriptional regulator [Streptomyces canus]|uniref:TetR/AcrR family transcriptional regulator n=1 Tax=Streptomyces canus TaxID=58343 RepID=UPI002E36BE03|nr:TetR/AcrR family transcriptional regulator [Streptomyces canus]
MGRTSDARQKILGAARSLIEGRGYSALGVAEICKAAGVPKGSFYYFFESKEALALAVVDEHWAGTLALELSNHAEPVRGQLQEIFDAQVDMVEAVVAEARDRGDVTVSDPREAARAVPAQLEGQVMFAKLYNSPQRLSPLWDNCLLRVAGS